MRLPITMLIIAVLGGCFITSDSSESRAAYMTPGLFESSKHSAPPPATLCTKDERVIFSCPVKRPAKIVSLCASKDVTNERGYLQYRFGLPGKVELEFPKERTGTQQKFHYRHYFRAQFYDTSIGFTIDGFEYSIFDGYDGEAKPAVSSQGVSVAAPGKPKEISFVCRTKPKADYAALEDVLPNEQQ